MAAATAVARKSPIVRAQRAATLAGARAVFAVLERTAPGLGAWWAERLWFTVPDSGSRWNSQTPPGRRFELAVHGRRVVGETWGEGPMVCLLHGWGGRRAHLVALVGPLVAAGHRVVAIDAPGHGESESGPAGAGRSTIVEFADALAALCAAQGPAHVVVAHSIGCMAAAVAVRDGVPVGRLVLLAPMSDIRPYTQEFARRVGFGERIRIRLVRRLERRVAKPLSFFDIPAMVQQMVTPPTLLVHDREDLETQWADSAAITQAWPDARLVTTSGLGHRRILRDPGVVDEIVTFIKAP